MSFFDSLKKVLRENVREYGMFIALFAIMAIFTITTKGVFISSRNIVNLVNQTGYIAVLSVGMTLVIVIRHIDLSVGYLAGFLGAVCAISMVGWGLPVYTSIPLVLILGMIAGLFTGFLVAQMKIPAFVATLAGWLGWRGALLLATVRTGTIIIPDDTFNAIGNGFIPDLLDIGILPGVHKLTLLVGLLAVIYSIFSSIRSRKKKIAYNFEVLPTAIFILQQAFTTLLIGAITWVLAGYQGLSWTAVVVIGIVLIYDFISTQTVLGRHIYAVGGNPDAAELSGINVKKITYVVFGSMGMLSALSGVLFASRLQSATTTAGLGFELDAIAGCFIGGTSPAGGIGKVMGSLIGALVMTSLTSGMNLMGMDISYQYIVRAAVLVVAVIFDVTTRSRGK